MAGKDVYNFVCFLWLIAFYISVISSQVSGLTGNIFGLTSARFSFKFVLIIIIVIWKRCPLTIQKEHIYIIVGACMADLICTACLYSVATFMAVGNLDAIFISFYYIISVLVGFIRRTVTWHPLISALMVSIGTNLANARQTNARNPLLLHR